MSEHQPEANKPNPQERRYRREAAVAYKYLQAILQSYAEETGEPLPQPSPVDARYIPLSDKFSSFMDIAYVGILRFAHSDQLQLALSFAPAKSKVRREEATGALGHAERKNYDLYPDGTLRVFDYTLPAERRGINFASESYKRLIEHRDAVLSEALAAEEAGESRISTVPRFNQERAAESGDLEMLHMLLGSLSQSHPTWPSWNQFRREQLDLMDLNDQLENPAQ